MATNTAPLVPSPSSRPRVSPAITSMDRIGPSTKFSLAPVPKRKISHMLSETITGIFKGLVFFIARDGSTKETLKLVNIINEKGGSTKPAPTRHVTHILVRLPHTFKQNYIYPLPSLDPEANQPQPDLTDADCSPADLIRHHAQEAKSADTLDLNGYWCAKTIVLDARWVEKCLAVGKKLEREQEWSGCLVRWSCDPRIARHTPVVNVFADTPLMNLPKRQHKYNYYYGTKMVMVGRPSVATSPVIPHITIDEPQESAPEDGDGGEERGVKGGWQGVDHEDVDSSFPSYVPAQHSAVLQPVPDSLPPQQRLFPFPQQPEPNLHQSCPRPDFPVTIDRTAEEDDEIPSPFPPRLRLSPPENKASSVDTATDIEITESRYSSPDRTILPRPSSSDYAEATPTSPHDHSYIASPQYSTPSPRITSPGLGPQAYQEIIDGAPPSPTSSDLNELYTPPLRPGLLESEQGGANDPETLDHGSDAGFEISEAEVDDNEYEHETDDDAGDGQGDVPIGLGLDMGGITIGGMNIMGSILRGPETASWGDPRLREGEDGKRDIWQSEEEDGSRSLPAERGDVSQLGGEDDWVEVKMEGLEVKEEAGASASRALEVLITTLGGRIVKSISHAQCVALDRPPRTLLSHVDLEGLGSIDLDSDDAPRIINQQWILDSATAKRLLNVDDYTLNIKRDRVIRGTPISPVFDSPNIPLREIVRKREREESIDGREGAEGERFGKQKMSRPGTENGAGGVKPLMIRIPLTNKPKSDGNTRTPSRPAGNVPPSVREIHHTDFQWMCNALQGIRPDKYRFRRALMKRLDAMRDKPFEQHCERFYRSYSDEFMSCFPWMRRYLAKAIVV